MVKKKIRFNETRFTVTTRRMNDEETRTRHSDQKHYDSSKYRYNGSSDTLIWHTSLVEYNAREAYCHLGRKTSI